MPRIEKDGTLIAAINADMLEDWLEENDLSADDVTITWSDAETRARRRTRIADDAGDTPSLLGTTSDGAHLLLIHMARLATALKSAQNIAAVRAAATPFADLVEAYLERLDAEEPTAKLPYAVKPGGEAAALLELEARATAVAEAFEEAD